MIIKGLIVQVYDIEIFPNCFSLTIKNTETKEYVNFTEYIEDSIVPQLEMFIKETRDIATSWAKNTETSFKKFFLEKLLELDDAIKAKIEEQERALADQKHFNEMIEQNKKNLAWLNGFKQELDNILTV